MRVLVLPQFFSLGVPIAAAAASFDPATTAWVNAVIANGGTVSDARKTIVDNLIVGLKADSVFTKLDRLWLLAAENAASALTDIVGDALAIVVGTPTFTTDRGYGTDFSTLNYLDSNFTPSLAGGHCTLNSAHLSAWIETQTTNTSFPGAIGATTAVTNLLIEAVGGSFNYDVWLNDASQLTTGVSGTGLWMGSRTAAAARAIYRNGVSKGSDAQTTAGLLDQPPFIGCQSQFGGPHGGGEFSGGRIAAASIGGGFTATDATNFYNRMRTYMTAVGVA